jgi:hypothetical protein
MHFGPSQRHLTFNQEWAAVLLWQKLGLGWLHPSIETAGRGKR